MRLRLHSSQPSASGANDTIASQQLSLSLRVVGALPGRTLDGCSGAALCVSKVLARASVCHSQGERAEAVQDPCAVRHRVVESQGLDPASGSWLPPMQGLSPEQSQHLPLRQSGAKQESAASACLLTSVCSPKISRVPEARVSVQLCSQGGLMLPCLSCPSPSLNAL